MTSRLIPHARIAALAIFAIAADRTAAEDLVLAFEGEPASFLPGIVASEYSEVRVVFSPSGDTLLWGSSNRPGGAGGYDIFRARRTTTDGVATWSAPQPVPINSASRDYDPAFSADGRYVYFFSDRPGGLGGDDIHRAAYDEASGRFGEVENLGARVNSAGNEWAPTPLGDGSLLYASNGRGGRGKQDLFIARPAAGAQHTDRKAKRRSDDAAAFLAAEPLPGGVNTPGDDFDATFLHDGVTLLVSRSADVMGDQPVQLYLSTRSARGWTEGLRLPETINVEAGYTFGPSIDPRTPGVLYFTSHAPHPSEGKLDVYRIVYRSTPAG